MDINEITGSIVDAAMKVHAALGPGLLQGVYEKGLKHELRKGGLKSEKQVGRLINFNVVHRRHGIWRIVNHYQPSACSSVVV